MDNPIELFHDWLQQAKDHPAISEPTAMSLATAAADGMPSCRIVLLKQADMEGFVFYTNHEGRKSIEIQANPKAALCFYWMPLDRQIRVEGTVEKVSDAMADAYFASRARGSQIGAWASRQSQPMEHDTSLTDRIKAYEQQFAGQNIPRPPHWSGWRVVPQRIEFWLQGDFRVHDRWEYMRSPEGGWTKTHLYP